jgi:hypothetical protein
MQYSLTKKDVEKLLDKSSKTVSRYIKAGKLHPIKKKTNGYMSYRFALEDVEDFIKGQGGHRGQTTKGQGTNDNSPTPNNQDRVNNLNGGTGGTNDVKKDTPEDIGDRTEDKGALPLLEKTLDMLQTTLDNQSKQIENQSRQIDNLTNTQQFLINENTGFRKMLGLPTTREDIVNETKEGEVVDTEEGTKDRTQDKPKKKGGTKTKRQPKKKPSKKAKTTKRHRGQKPKTKPKTKPITSKETVKQKVAKPSKTLGKKLPRVKKSKPKEKFNLFKWIKG